MRLDRQEIDGLKFALKDFRGKVYLFGSRLDENKRGGDIDILLVPQKKTDSLKLSIEIQAKFFSRCEEKIDVVVYEKNNIFCHEILENAERLIITGT